MLGAFKTVDKFITGESWVVGDDAAGVDKAKLVADLSARYTADYVAQWRKFLQAASVARYSSVRDAAQKLSAMSQRQPVAAPRALLRRVAEHGSGTARSRRNLPARATDYAAYRHGQSHRATRTRRTSTRCSRSNQSPRPNGERCKVQPRRPRVSQASGNATAARTAAR